MKLTQLKTHTMERKKAKLFIITWVTMQCSPSTSHFAKGFLTLILWILTIPCEIHLSLIQIYSKTKVTGSLHLQPKIIPLEVKALDSTVSYSVRSDFVTSWTTALQAPQSMGFSRQEYWSGLPFPSPGDLPDRGIQPQSPTLQADSLPSEPPMAPNSGF